MMQFCTLFHILQVFYTLNVAGFSSNSGSAVDALTQHNGCPFSTYDKDNDEQDHQSCATIYKGAWW